MFRKVWIVLALVLIVPGLFLSGCCPKKKVPATSAVEEGAGAGQQEGYAAGQSEQELQEAALREAERRRLMEEQQKFVNEDIYFDFDKSNLRSDAQDILTWKGDWLRRNSGVSIIIEGHCDERGTNEYNMALGERRAMSAKSFLQNLGVSAERMTTISYGEERPFAPGHDEDSYAQNRRAHFVTQ